MSFSEICSRISDHLLPRGMHDIAISVAVADVSQCLPEASALVTHKRSVLEDLYGPRHVHGGLIGTFRTSWATHLT